MGRGTRALTLTPRRTVAVASRSRYLSALRLKSVVSHYGTLWFEWVHGTAVPSADDVCVLRGIVQQLPWGIHTSLHGMDWPQLEHVLGGHGACMYDRPACVGEPCPRREIIDEMAALVPPDLWSEFRAASAGYSAVRISDTVAEIVRRFPNDPGLVHTERVYRLFDDVHLVSSTQGRVGRAVHAQTGREVAPPAHSKEGIYLRAPECQGLRALLLDPAIQQQLVRGLDVAPFAAWDPARLSGVVIRVNDKGLWLRSTDTPDVRLASRNEALGCAICRPNTVCGVHPELTSLLVGWGWRSWAED